MAELMRGRPSNALSGARPGTEPAAALISSDDVLGPDRRVLIEHRGQTYELRETRQGKLILTK
jgi:hemin uptake protein HemP